MTKQSVHDNLLRVKLALTAKYQALAKVAKSQVKRRHFLHIAEKYRLQAATLSG